MSVTITRARDLAQYISSRLGTITVANGYETDIGLRVYRGKRKVDEHEVPCAVLLEGEDKPTSSQGPASQKVEQSYVLGGYVHCDIDHPNDAAHMVISDIKRALFSLGVTATRAEQITGTATFGGRVKSVTYRGRDIGPRADGVGIVYAIVHVSVEFVEQLDAA